MGGESGAAGTPSFRVTCQSGESRRGCLKGKLETPAALLYTRRGFPPALTLRELDALAKATSAPGEDNGELLALQIDAADFFEQNNNDTALAKCEGGIRSFCGLQGRDHFTLVTHRDALNLQSGMPASDGWVTMQSPGGQLKVTVDDYVRFLGAAAPDAAVCLADEVAGDANPNRVRKSAERAAEWTSKCLAARAAGAIPADTLLFAPAMGGVIDRERARAAKEVAVRGADGYALCGLGHWEAPAERAALVAASIAALADPARPRVLLGVGGPAEMLQAIALGADLVETAYPYSAAVQGLALTFPVAYEEVMAAAGADAPARREAGAGELGGKLDLRDTGLRKDARAIAPECGCSACGRHSRAYIHHLLNTREMLAEVLIAAHNHHVVLRLMVQPPPAATGGGTRCVRLVRGGGTRCVRLVRGEGRGVSVWYGVTDEGRSPCRFLSPRPLRAQAAARRAIELDRLPDYIRAFDAARRAAP